MSVRRAFGVSRAVRDFLVGAAALALAGTVAVAAPVGAAADPAVQSNQAWAMSQLARADQLLRHGRPRAAGRVFLEVFEGTQGTPWSAFAELGLAWSAVASGDLASARYLSSDALHEAGIASDLADVMVALLDANEGSYTNAVNRLTRVIDAAATTPAGRSTARLARGYVHYWAGSHARAIADFDLVATQDATGSLVDDAAYAAALVRIASGDETTGIAALRQQLATAPPGTRFSPVSDALVSLEARAILRDSFRRYRKGGVQMPDAQLVRLLDGDGLSRARAALRRFDVDETAAAKIGSHAAHMVRPPAAAKDRAGVRRRASAADAPGPSIGGDTTVSEAPRAVVEPSRSYLGAALALTLLAAMVFTLAVRRRLGSRPS